MEKVHNESELDDKTTTTVTSCIQNNSTEENKIESVIDENDKNILRNLLLHKKIDVPDKNVKDNILDNSSLFKSNDYLNNNENDSIPDASEKIDLKHNDLELLNEQNNELKNNENAICITQNNNDNNNINNNNEINESSNDSNIYKSPEVSERNIQDSTEEGTLGVINNNRKINIRVKSVESLKDYSNTINLENESSKDDSEESINEISMENDSLETNEKNCDVNSDSNSRNNNLSSVPNTSSWESNDDSGSNKLSLKNTCDNDEFKPINLSLSSKSINIQNDSEIESKCHSIEEKKNESKEENCLNLNLIEQNKFSSFYNKNTKFAQNNPLTGTLALKQDDSDSFEEITTKTTLSLKEYLKTNSNINSKSTYSNNEILLNSNLSTSLSDTSKSNLTDLTKIENYENESSDKTSYLSNDSMDNSRNNEILQSSEMQPETTPKNSPVKNYLISPALTKFDQQESSCDSNSSSNLVIDQEWDQKNTLKRKLSPKTNGENSPTAKHFHFDVLVEDKQDTNPQLQNKFLFINELNLIAVRNQEDSNKTQADNNKNKEDNNKTEDDARTNPIQNQNQCTLNTQIDNNLSLNVSNRDTIDNESEELATSFSKNSIVSNIENEDNGKIKIHRNNTGKLKPSNKRPPRKRKKTKPEHINNISTDLIPQQQETINQQIFYHNFTNNLKPVVQESEQNLNYQKSIYPIRNSTVIENYPIQFMHPETHQQPQLMQSSYHNLQSIDQNTVLSSKHRSIQNSEYHPQQLLQLPNKIFESPQKNKTISNMEIPIQQQSMLNYQLMEQPLLQMNSSQNGPLSENHLQSLNSMQRIGNNSLSMLLTQGSDNYNKINNDRVTSQFQIVPPQVVHQLQTNSLQQPQSISYSQSSYQQPIYQYQMANELPMQLIEEPQTNIVQYKCFKCLTACFSTIQDLQEHQKYCLFRDKILPQNNQLQSGYAIMPNNENVQYYSGVINEIENQNNIDNTRKSVQERKRKFYLCSACGTYHQNWNLFLHMRKIHRKYICLYCMGLFPSGQKLTMHLEIKHNIEKNHYKSQFELLKSCKGTSCFLMCSTCEYIFNEHDDFYEHICRDLFKSCLQCDQKGHTHTECIQKNKSNATNTLEMKQSKNINQNQNENMNNLNKNYSKNNVEILDNNNIHALNNTKDQIDSDDGGNYLEHFNYNDNDLINLYKSNRNLLKQKQEQEQKQKEEFLELEHEKSIASDHLNELETQAMHLEPQQECETENEKSLVVPKMKLIIPKEYQNQSTIESEESSTESEKGDETSTTPTKSNIDEENDKDNDKNNDKDNDKDNDESLKLNVSIESRNDSDMDIDVTCNSREQYVGQQQISSQINLIENDFPRPILSDDIKLEKLDNEGSGDVPPKLDFPFVETKSTQQEIESILKTTAESTPVEPENLVPSVQINIIKENEETPKNVEKVKPNDGIELADEDSTIQELSLEAPLDKIPMVQFLRICLQETHGICLYCYHARRIAVNGHSLALHMLAQHRFSATVDSITAEELQPQTIILKLKSFLPELDDYYFNLETYCNISQDDSVKLAKTVDESLFECFQCRFVTKIHKELYVHNRKMHLRTAILCYMCRSNFYSYSEILCHICPGAPNKQIIFDIKFRCCLCDLDNIQSAFRLMVHLRKKHLACDVCLEYCFDQSRLSGHVWKHKLHHLCYRCGIAYRNKPDITKHLFWKHGTESVLCKRCLQKRWPHVYHFCIPPPSFICETCQLTFSRAMYLKVHKRLHSGEDPYPCTEDNCDQKFISRKILLKHVEEHSAAPALKEIEENNLNLKKEYIDDLPKDGEIYKMETNSKEKENKESKEKCEHSKKKRKKSKREPKELLADLNLQAPNLSESGSSDSDTDNDSATKRILKKPMLSQPENELVPCVMLSPASEFGDDDASGSDPKVENQSKAFDVWKNFQHFQASQSQESEITKEDKIDEMDITPILRAVESDHDYCVTFKSAVGNKNSENSIQALTEVKECEFVKLEPMSNKELPPKTRKDKSPKKNHQSGNESDSSSSNSSSDSSSSCSCGSNCSCSSGSSSSSSGSSSSSDSDNSTLSAQDKKKSTLKRVAREERRNKRKDETIKNSSTEIVDVVTNDIIPVKLEPIILESDLATEESDTDEDFYDEHPQKLANEMLAEKRRQLMQQMSPSHQNNFDIVENSRPSTPSLPGEEMAKEKRNKGKKKKRKNSSKTLLSTIKLNGTEVISHKPTYQIPPQQISSINSISTIQQNIFINSGIAEPQLLPPPIPISHINHIQTPLSAMALTSHAQQIYQGRLSTESSSDAGVVGSLNGSLKRSKRARRPNRFYGYSSDEDNPHQHSVTNFYVGGLKPTPPPQLKWSKEDLPSPSKSILSHKNYKTILNKKSGTFRISKKKENSTKTLKMKLTKTLGAKILPPIPTLKIRPSDIFPQIPPSPLDYQPPRPRPVLDKPQPAQYDLNTGPVVQSVVNLPSLPIPHIETVPNKLFDTSGTGEEDDEDSSSSDDDKLTIPVNSFQKTANQNKLNQQMAISLEALHPPMPPPKKPEPRKIPPALLPNPDFATIQYFKRNNIRYPIKPPAGARPPREGESVYCYCRCPYDEVSEMIACDGNTCVIEWFHFECVGILMAPQGKWYCAECKAHLATLQPAVPIASTSASASTSTSTSSSASTSASVKFEYFKR